MMRRGVKWALVITVLALVIITIGIILYFTIFNRNTYHVTAIEHTTYEADDFHNSELKFYNNHTFHLSIIYGENEIFFVGLGTYTKDNGNYVLTFMEAYGRENGLPQDQIAKYSEPVTCQKSGSRIKFTDHNNQVYYFG